MLNRLSLPYQYVFQCEMWNQALTISQVTKQHKKSWDLLAPPFHMIIMGSEELLAGHPERKLWT